MIVRYPGASIPATGGDISTFTGDGTIGASGVEYWVHTFTDSGTFGLQDLDVDARLAAEITGEISGEGDLVFVGPGRLTLSGTSTYTGATIVEGGTLIVDGTLSGTSGLVVRDGATLSGSGTIAGNVTLESGSTLRVTGTLEIGGILTIESGVTLDYAGASVTTLATYAGLEGDFAAAENLPEGFLLEYGATELSITSSKPSIFRFR